MLSQGVGPNDRLQFKVLNEEIFTTKDKSKGKFSLDESSFVVSH